MSHSCKPTPSHSARIPCRPKGRPENGSTSEQEWNSRCDGMFLTPEQAQAPQKGFPNRLDWPYMPTDEPPWSERITDSCVRLEPARFAEPSSLTETKFWTGDQALS